MSGVTMSIRKGRSIHQGNAILAWLNMAQPLRMTSNRNTASGEAPSGTTTTIFHSMDSAISTG
jgi:hypothetical protein